MGPRCSFKTLHLHELKHATSEISVKSVNLLVGTEKSPEASPGKYVPKPHPEGELKEIHLFEREDPRMVKIGADLPASLEGGLVASLRRTLTSLLGHLPT